MLASFQGPWWRLGDETFERPPARQVPGRFSYFRSRSAFRRASPWLALSGLDVGAQAADEVPPALHHGLGGGPLPAAVLERQLRRIAIGYQAARERRADPGVHVVTDTRPAHGAARVMSRDTEPGWR